MSVAPALLLDTHIWLDYANAAPGLRPATVHAIDQVCRTGSLYISVISVWEIALLVRKGKLRLDDTPSRWTGQALKLPGLQLLSFTPEIAIASVDLPEPMYKDPADRILVASAQVERLTLVTRDRDILAFAQLVHLSCLQD